MCQKLGLEYHPDLIDPYKDKEKKMTDGIYAVSAPMGDTKFTQYQGIDPKVAEGWKEVTRDNFLGEVTWEWAERLGYERVGCQAALGSGWRPEMAIAQSRAWQAEQGELARLLAEVESLSEDEAKQLLANESAAADKGIRHE
jgi:hypothetical protein